jgi:hypothetical protein
MTRKPTLGSLTYQSVAQTSLRMVLVFLGLASASVSSHAQSKEALAARQVCEPIIAAAVTSQVNIDRKVFTKDASTSWLCSQTYSSEEEASNAGLDISGVVDGVKIGFLYSNDQKRRSEARAKLCTAASSSADSSYRVLVSEVTRDPSYAHQYNACVARVIQSAGDLACYFTPAINDPTSLKLSVIYRPAGVRVGKFSLAKLTGAEVEGGGEILSLLKRRQPQPFNATKPVSAFVAEIPIKRVSLGGGGFELALDDGANCTPDFDGVPASMKVTLMPVGKSLSRTLGRHSYVVDVGRDCGTDNPARTLNVELADGVLGVTQQDLLGQVQSTPQSSNCPTTESRITSVVRKDDQHFDIEYNLVGCGYRNWVVTRECKGGGWLKQYGFIATRAIDPTMPSLSTHSEVFNFLTGRIDATVVRFMQGLEPDFLLQDFQMTAAIRVPTPAAGTGAPTYQNIVLRGYAKNAAAPGTSFCSDWNVGAKKQSVAAAFVRQDVVVIFQFDGSCESYKNQSTKIVADIAGISPEAICSSKADGIAKLPGGVPSDKLTPADVFDKTLACKP